MRLHSRAIVYLALCGWTIVCLFPIYWLAITSVKGFEDIDKPPTYLPFVDFQPSFQSWRFILNDPFENLTFSLMNSFFVGACSTLICLTVSGLLLYGLTRFKATFRWSSLAILLGAAGGVFAGWIPYSPIPRPVLFALAGLVIILGVVLKRIALGFGPFGATALVLATRCIPPVVLALPLYFMAVSTRAYDTLFLLVMAYSTANLPVAIWLLQPAIGASATEQEEAAYLEGASRPLILFGILLPMIRPTVLATGLVVFLLSWNEYLFASYLTGGQAQTLPIWMAEQLSMKEAQAGGEAEEWGHMSAVAILMAVPALMFAAYGIRAIGAASLRPRL